MSVIFHHSSWKKAPCRPAMVPMNFMWCSSQWIRHESTMVFWNIWTFHEMMIVPGGPLEIGRGHLCSLWGPWRIGSDPIRKDGAGGAWWTCPEELELKSSNISHTSLMGALAPWQINENSRKATAELYVSHCENGVKWVKEQGIIFEILNHTEPFLYFPPFPEANCHLSLWMPAAIWVCPKVMKMGISQSLAFSLCFLQGEEMIHSDKQWNFWVPSGFFYIAMAMV